MLTGILNLSKKRPQINLAVNVGDIIISGLYTT